MVCYCLISELQIANSKFTEMLYLFIAGKYETIGSLAVSTLLIGGALGIGWHSTELLMNVLHTPGVNESVSTAVATAVDPSTSPALAETATHKVVSVTDHHGHTLNPNAAWFALISIVVKEWLYRASMLRFVL
jgi:divalent metal cation (Fe/Co/Zn/Cd) transporter